MSQTKLVSLKGNLQAGGDFLMLGSQRHEVSRENERKAGMTVCSGLVRLPKKQKRHGSRDLKKFFLHLE